MTTRLVAPPAALAVSMAAARMAARVDTDADGTSPLDDEIARAVRTYTAEAEHITGRAFVTQTWRLTLDAFHGAIRLEKPPLASVVHIKFYDASGLQQTLAPQDYMPDLESEPGYVVPVPGRTWPSTADRINAVEVQYTCGYGGDDTFVPDAIKGYILARVQQQFAPVATAKTADFECLLDREKVYA
jgi:uncharacterized phiE125 gp8 family phage protein